MKRILTVLVVLITSVVVATSTALGTAYPLPAELPLGGRSVNKKVINCDNWVSLRVEPDTSAERIAEVPLGAIVTFCEDYGDFTYCQYDGKEGYILSEYLGELTGEEAATVNPWGRQVEPPTASSGTVNYATNSNAVQELSDRLGSMTVAEILSDEGKLAAIASGIVPADVDFSAYKVDRLMGIGIRDAEIADMTVIFPIVPAYSQGSVLLAIVAKVENGATTYTACSCEVGNDNAVHVVIPAATVDAIQNGAGETVMIIAVG